MTKLLFVCNWKMAPENLGAARTLFTGTKRLARSWRKGAVVVCPPAPFLGALSGATTSAFSLGAQDVSSETATARTGEVSVAMLRGVGAKFVIIGHSERRALGESDALVARKTAAALAGGLTPIVCVGEQVRDEKGSHFAFLHEQLVASLKGVSKSRAKNIVLAYEPVWAIGKTYQSALDAYGLHETTIFLRKTLIKLFGRAVGMSIRILYGGSVEPNNVAALTSGTGIGGFLVGHASLDIGMLRHMFRALS